MKSLILFIVIANTAYGQSGYTITNRTGTTRSIVTLSLPNFRGAATSTSGTTSTTTPRYADDPVAAYTENPLAEIREYTPRDIGYAEPTYTFPVTADIAPAVATDATVLGATTTTKSSWSKYSPTIDYAAPLEAEMYSGGATRFSGVADTWSSALPESPTWSTAVTDSYSDPVRSDTSTTTTTTTVAVTSPATTTATVSTSPYTNTNYVEPTPAPAPDPVFAEPTRTEIVPMDPAPVSSEPIAAPRQPVYR